MKFRTATVNVTAEDIAKGWPGWSGRCPLALAMSRACGTGVQVGLFSYFVGIGSEARLPDKAAAFRQRYDGGKPVKPFTFKARLPAPAAQGQGEQEPR